MTEAFSTSDKSDCARIAAVQRWIERLVVHYNLCPFARRELEQARVRFAVTAADNEPDLLQALEAELELLGRDAHIETSFLIHPAVLQDFYDYNQFLGECERLLAALALTGVYQIASFHPQYQFAGTAPGDAENYSNRSPYPMLHILREGSVERAIESYADIEAVPDRNIATMNQLGSERLEAILRDCLHG